MTDDVAMRVLVMNPIRLFADSIASIFQMAGHGTHVITTMSATAAQHEIRFFEPHAVVMTFDVVGRPASRKLLTDIVALGVPVVALTAGEDLRSPLIALDSGAQGFVSRTAGGSSLLEGVEQAARGGRLNDPQLVERLRTRKTTHDRLRAEHLASFMDLSQRESEVLADLVRGLTAERIAAARSIKLSTVRSHIRSVLKKLGVSSQIEAVARANDANWRGPERSVPAYEGRASL